jgi:hypothetical protein
MRFDTADIAQAVDNIRACTHPLLEVLAAAGLRTPRLRTAVGMTPVELRKPDTSDGVPTATDVPDDGWLDLIDL